MSDDEDDCYEDDDDDDYYYVDEGPVTEADDLAEHTMHSPVWPDNHPSYEMAEGWSDWEYYSDDYYDQESPTQGRQIAEEPGKTMAIGKQKRKAIGEGRKVRKRRKLVQTNGSSRPSLGDPRESDASEGCSPAPIVKWKEELVGPETYLVGEHETEKVALLKDWRERFRVAPENSRSRTLTSVRQGPNLDTVAVAIKHPSRQHGRPKQDSPTTCSISGPFPGRVKQSLTSSDTSGNSLLPNESSNANGNLSDYSAFTRTLGTNEGKGPTDHEDGQRRGASHSSATTKLREFAANPSYQAKVPNRKRKTQDEPTPEPDGQTQPCFIEDTGASAVELSKPVTRHGKRQKRE